MRSGLPALLQYLAVMYVREIQLNFLRFKTKSSVIKLTTPFHFPVSVSVHSSAVKLVVFGPCFPPEAILQGKNKDTVTLSVH